VFPLPDGFKTEDEYLRHLTYEGAERLYPKVTEEIRDRLDFELKVISEMGFPGYFLIVQDFIAAARKMGVIVGPGRGSAAGSAVAYCTGITNIDPIKYNLLFERFLNPERVTMPDIDIDFDDEGRDKVLSYVEHKYGYNRVAQIITFGTMAARLAIRDVARVLRLPLPDADKLAKLVPERPGITLERAYKEVKELADIRKSGLELEKKTLTFAETLEGSARHTGLHACGVIIGPDDLIDHLPLSVSKDSDMMVTQYEGKLVESVGMLKMDFLGLKTLSIIKDAIRNIEKRHGNKIDIDTIPLDDAKTFELYQRGDTIGTFQFESDGMRNYLKELKPTNVEDLIAMNALYRPGPMNFIPIYINRKHGREKVEYPHPMLEDILRPTFGIMVYQEQIMQAAQIMAGFSLGRADILRRAMGKKKMDIMAAQKVDFVKGAGEKGIPGEKAEEIFTVMERFAEYGFNRSHSAAYSVIAYQTAYLKAHYPAEYMAAVLTHNINDIKKITFFIDECKRHDIDVLGPDINESYLDFIVNKEGQVRFGLGAIKNVGESAVQAIIKEREENGVFSDIFDFSKRISLKAVNKRCMESLAMAGAFDNFENTHRAQYFFRENTDDSIFLEKVIKFAASYQERINTAQVSLFGEDSEITVPDPELPECEPWSKLQQLKNEKEVTGFYMSGHPLDDYKIEIENFCNVALKDLNEDLKSYIQKNVTFAGIVTETLHRTAKNGKPFGTFIMEDFTDSKQFMIFSEDYLKMKHFLIPGSYLLVKARVGYRFNSEDQLEVKIMNMNLLAETIDKYAGSITLKLTNAEVDEGIIQKIRKLIKSNPGKCEVKFRISDPDDNTSLELKARNNRVNAAQFVRELKKELDIEFILS
jgi:DNA polymerase-3 subunit alpha